MHQNLYYEYEFLLKNGEKEWYSPVNPEDDIRFEDIFKLSIGDFTYTHKVVEIDRIYLTVNEGNQELKRETVFKN